MDAEVEISHCLGQPKSPLHPSFLQATIFPEHKTEAALVSTLFPLHGNAAHAPAPLEGGR